MKYLVLKTINLLVVNPVMKNDRGTHLPSAEKLYDEVVAVPLVQQLRDEVQVGHQGGLQDDGHVGGVEQLDLVVLLHAATLLVTHRQVHMEPL